MTEKMRCSLGSSARVEWTDRERRGATEMGGGVGELVWVRTHLQGVEGEGIGFDDVPERGRCTIRIPTVISILFLL